MKKMFVTSMVISMFIATYAQAFPGVEALTQQLAKKGASPDVQVKAPENCTDFSGHWKGSCKIQGTSSDSDLNIEQTQCVFLKIGNEFETIGGIQSQTMASVKDPNNSYAGVNTLVLDWNADRSEIVGFGGGAYQATFNKGTEGGYALRVNMKLDGGKLVSHMDAKTYGSSGVADEINCVYEKQ